MTFRPFLTTVLALALAGCAVERDSSVPDRTPRGPVNRRRPY